MPGADNAAGASMGQGDPIPAAHKDYVGTASGASAGKGWDTFNMGLGDKL